MNSGVRLGVRGQLNFMILPLSSSGTTGKRAVMISSLLFLFDTARFRAAAPKPLVMGSPMGSSSKAGPTTSTDPPQLAPPKSLSFPETSLPILSVKNENGLKRPPDVENGPPTTEAASLDFDRERRVKKSFFASTVSVRPETPASPSFPSLLEEEEELVLVVVLSTTTRFRRSENGCSPHRSSDDREEDGPPLLGSSEDAFQLSSPNGATVLAVSRSSSGASFPFVPPFYGVTFVSIIRSMLSQHFLD